MTVVGSDLISISGATAGVAPLLTCIAVSWFVNPQAVERRRLTLTWPKSWLQARGWRQALGGSLTVWALACGAAVIVLHNATGDLGPRVGAYPTGIATIMLFALAAAIVMRRRIARALVHRFVPAAAQYKLQQNPPSHNFVHALGTSWSIKPKTWQKIHIAVAIGAMLPLWWHCDPGRASIVDHSLKSVALLLLMSGFLGIVITDFTRWRLLSPNFSPRLSASLIRGLFIAHRGLALLTFILITIHVLAVLYFAGI
jgi:hypothetical protein